MHSKSCILILRMSSVKMKCVIPVQISDTSSFNNIFILKAASSTTGPDLNSLKREPSRILNKDPSTWSIEEVMRFVKEADPQALAPHAELFRRHVRCISILF